MFISPHCCEEISTFRGSYFACKEFHLLEVDGEVFPVLAHGTTSISGTWLVCCLVMSWTLKIEGLGQDCSLHYLCDILHDSFGTRSEEK